MPYKEKEITRLYYSIREVADMFKVSVSLIRFWEKYFDVFKLRKNKKGDRFFTPEDLETFRLIYHLVKERGYTLEGAKKKLKQNKEDAIKNFEVVDSLKKIRGFLTEVRESLK